MGHRWYPNSLFDLGLDLDPTMDLAYRMVFLNARTSGETRGYRMPSRCRARLIVLVTR